MTGYMLSFDLGRITPAAVGHAFGVLYLHGGGICEGAADQKQRMLSDYSRLREAAHLDTSERGEAVGCAIAGVEAGTSADEESSRWRMIAFKYCGTVRLIQLLPPSQF